MIENLVQGTLSWLRERLPGAALEVAGKPSARYVRLPCAEGSDYRFQLWFYPDGEREISAELVAPATASDRYFWSWVFELDDFVNSPKALVQAFERELEAMLSVPTRIHQRRGLLFWSFTLEREVGTTWASASSCSALRASVSVVSIKGAQHTYHAGPVTGAQSHARA